MAFKVIGKIVDLDGLPLKQVYVSVNDKDQFMDDFLGRVETNEAGEFVLDFDEKLFNQDFLECEQTPDLYLMFFVQEDGQAKLIGRKSVTQTRFKEDHLDLGDIPVEVKNRL